MQDLAILSMKHLEEKEGQFFGAYLVLRALKVISYEEIHQQSNVFFLIIAIELRK